MLVPQAVAGTGRHVHGSGQARRGAVYLPWLGPSRCRFRKTPRIHVSRQRACRARFRGVSFAWPDSYFNVTLNVPLVMFLDAPFPDSGTMTKWKVPEAFFVVVEKDVTVTLPRPRGA